MFLSPTLVYLDPSVDPGILATVDAQFPVDSDKIQSIYGSLAVVSA